MRVVRAYGEIAELIISCTRTVLVAAGSPPAADADLRSRRLKTSRHRKP
jgi:hypothetical protein